MRLALSCIAILAISVSFAQIPSVIPVPESMNRGKGSFSLSPSTVIRIRNGVDQRSAVFLNDYLKQYYGFRLKLVKEASRDYIELSTLQMFVPGKEGAYRMQVSPQKVVIQGETASGTFYGMQTLLQLLPVPKAKSDVYELPVMQINDAPRFGYRGMHLDVARHFFPVSFIKHYIDLLALHKMNRFHWHLTDDQGWRIPISKYPLLTDTGAWRNGTIVGRYPGTGNDNLRYGGSYTKEEIREVVNYAANRYIEVIPEIEMPGHASAAIAAYPYLSCFPAKPTNIPANMISAVSKLQQQNGRIKLVQETWGVFDDVFCAGKDSTFTFLESVLDEVLALFPSKYIHVGGDECPKTHWKQCPSCQARIKALGLKDEHGLQSWFIQRIEKYLNAKGRILIGWDEILEGGLAPNAVVMSWRGEQGGIEAARQGHDVVMTPGNPVYFDHSQSSNEDSVTIGGYNPIEAVYAYNPVPATLDSVAAGHILGAQANLWTEYIGNIRKVEYQLLPRLAALSEILWSTNEKRNAPDFENRLMTQFRRYDRWGLNYSRAYFDLRTKVLPMGNLMGVTWQIQSKYISKPADNYRFHIQHESTLQQDSIFRDTIAQYYINDIFKVTYKIETDTLKAGQKAWVNIPVVPDTENLYSIPVEKSAKLRAWESFHHTKGKVAEQEFFFNKATGKSVTLLTAPSERHPGNGAFTLVDGVRNTKGLSKSREFLGFTGDCDFQVDLDGAQEISSVTAHVYQLKPSWIWSPASMEVFVSENGQYYNSLGTTSVFLEEENGHGVMRVRFNRTNAKYVKVVLKNQGIIREGNAGAGNPAWLFIDEVDIE